MQRVNKKKTILERLSSSNIRYDNDVLERICNWQGDLREDFINKNELWIECVDSQYEKNELKDRIVDLVVSYIEKKLRFVESYDVFHCESTYFYDDFIQNDNFLDSSYFDKIVMYEDSYYIVLNLVKLENLCSKFAKEFIGCYKQKRNFKD